MGTHTGTGNLGWRGAFTAAARPGLAVDTAPEAAARLTPVDAVRGRSAVAEPPPAPSEVGGTARPSLKFRGPAPDPGPAPLPPLRPARPSGPTAELPSISETPRWSPVAVAVPLFVAVWVVFAVLAARAAPGPETDIAGLGHLLATGAGIVALVLVTLSVVHAQISGLRPRAAVVGVVGVGAGQGALAWGLGTGPSDLWSVGAWLLALIGLTVPLAWVGGQFQRGVRRHRDQQHAFLTASWIEQARHRAHDTVQSVQRHDIRSLLFVIDGAAQTLVDHDLSAAQRASFGEMLTDSVRRLSALTDVRSAEIQPFAVDDVARAVVHAERRAGRTVIVDLAESLTALGRAADVAAVLRTLVAVTGREDTGAVRLRGRVDHDGAVVVDVERAGAEPLALLTGNWEQIWAESFKAARNGDEDSVDLYVAARLLAEQGADLWTVPSRRQRFVVRLPSVAPARSQEET